MWSTAKVHPGVWLPVLLVLLLGLAPGGWAANSPGQKAVRQPDPHQVAFLPWGQGPGQVGKLIRKEGAAEGPQSFAVSANGEVFLLDQLNSRIIHLAADGTVLNYLPVPVARPECQEGATFVDIAVMADGRIVLLDNLIDHCFIILDQAGTLRHRHDLAAFGIAVRPGEQAVGNMALVDDELYVEDLGEGDYRRVFDRAGQPLHNDRFPGLPYKQRQQFILSRMDVDQHQKAYRFTLSVNDEKTRQVLKTASWLVKDHAYVLALNADRQNHLHLVYASFPEGRKPPTISETITWLRFDENLREISRRTMVRQEPLPLEMHVSARITPSGQLYLMNFIEKGVQIWRWQ